VRLHKYTHTLLHFKPLKSSAAMPPTQDRGARLFLGRTHHRDAPVSTAVGPLTGIPRWDTWQGRAAPSLPLSLSPPSPTYHRAPDSVPIPRGEGLPEWWALRGSGRVSPWPEVRTYRRASLPLPLGEVLPKGSTFSLHPAPKSVRSPRWSAFFRSSAHWVCLHSSSLLSCCGGAPSFLVWSGSNGGGRSFLFRCGDGGGGCCDAERGQRGRCGSAHSGLHGGLQLVGAMLHIRDRERSHPTARMLQRLEQPEQGQSGVPVQPHHHAAQQQQQQHLRRQRHQGLQLAQRLLHHAQHHHLPRLLLLQHSFPILVSLSLLIFHSTSFVQSFIVA
jgi:hypothetical protein